MTDEPGSLSAEVIVRTSGHADLTSTESTIVDNQGGAQILKFSPEEGKHRRQLQSDTHKQAMAQRELDHKLDLERRELDQKLAQERKQSDDRRHLFWLIVILLVAALITAIIVSLVADDLGTQQWAQGIATTILGGFLGAIAGYFAGRDSH